MSLNLNDLTVVRDVRPDFLLRADPADDEREGLGLMDVRFSPFDAWYRIDSWWEGTFLERTMRGAFKRTFDAHRSASTPGGKIKTLFNHGADFHIGDKLLGDIEEVAEDPDAARTTVWLWDTSYNRDLLPGLRSGAYGSSFMFQVIRDEWNEEPDRTDANPDGIPERTIKEARVLEAGPVTWPANPAATAGMRCLSGTDAYYESLQRRDPSLVTSLRALRGDRPALRRTQSAPRPAQPVPPSDPASATRTGLTSAARREFLMRKKAGRGPEGNA